ncbi:MAG: hypothetical protein IJP03_05565 [Christensenellaceae bacterium]|nr:hypothetical protein [Christensenellaceae bacterium]
MDQEKYKQLCDLFRQYGRVAVCLSGGSGSALVAKLAVDTLGKDQVIGITASTPFLTGEEMQVSERLCEHLGIRLLAPGVPLLSVEAIISNPEDRCYYCKKITYAYMRKMASECGIRDVLDGSTWAGDENRPYSAKAIGESGIVSPLKLVPMNKEEVFEALHELGMDRFIRPQNDCLATRILPGAAITVKKLRWIRAAENYLRRKGFDRVRVVMKDTEATIQVEKELIPYLREMQEEVFSELRGMYYEKVSIDPEGYPYKDSFR